MLYRSKHCDRDERRPSGLTNALWLRELAQQIGDELARSEQGVRIPQPAASAIVLRLQEIAEEMETR